MPSKQIKRIAIIGAGNMGYALASGLLRSGLVGREDLSVSDPDESRLDLVREGLGAKTTRSNLECVRDADVIILAVKPSVVPPVLDEISGSVGPSQLVISIAAGVRTSAVEARLPEGVPVVRVMPNTPALVMSGICAVCRGRFASEDHLDAARSIFSSVGDVVAVDERDMDAVTGLSGSGPAYIYVLIEALADGGVKMGLQRDVALRLAAGTVLGAAKMVTELGEHPAVLKDRVVSPGGTTAAGLSVLERRGFRSALIDAVEAATLRSKELGGK